jgi:hypothetical protein
MISDIPRAFLHTQPITVCTSLVLTSFYGFKRVKRVRGYLCTYVIGTVHIRYEAFGRVRL